MEINTDITTQDLIDFNLYHLSHSSIAKRQRFYQLLPGLMWSGFWLWAASLGEDPMRNIKALMPLISTGPLYIITVLVLWRWLVARQVHKFLAEGNNKGILGPQKIILSDNGVEDISELSQSSTSWKAVERVVANEVCLYIYVSAVSAVIVPKRSFTDEAAFEAYVQTAKDYHNRAVVT